MTETEGIRLQRYLAQSGVAARRKAEELITRGLVTVNGKTVTTLGTRVVPGKDRVTLEGKAVYPQDLLYIVLNKPKGCITAVSDPQGRQTVMEYLRGLPVQVAPVGRLDYYSEGVLLLTNDGELSARLQSPEHHVEKTYHVKIRGRVRPAHLEAMRRGVRLDDGTLTRPAKVDLLPAKSSHDWVVVTLTEGKSRQIHRMLEALGYQVTKLQRVAFAGLTYHGLRVGDARELTQPEVNHLREQVSLPKNTVSRGKWSRRREDTDLARRARERARVQAPPRPSDEAAPGPRAKPGPRAQAPSGRPRQAPASKAPPSRTRNAPASKKAPASRTKASHGPGRKPAAGGRPHKGTRKPGSPRR